ncbi:ABC-type amino acid transport substrate-binding protein [Amycolatopsis rubida]|uniref:ABC-type amino acid transport substrate-binding protein n=1 Tax=Amycolatopsis rubida TaxID=112413 RepID=A0A1I5ZHC4_9PSEU|nr:ABC-type amino acid transport substrate-binding protein [Amycolatopsis rubida]
MSVVLITGNRARRALAGCLAVIVSAGMLSGCAGSSGGSAPAVLVIGTSGDFPPWEYRESGGKVTGWMVDMVDHVLADAGYQAEWKQVSFTGLLPALQSGRIDLITSLYNTPERRKVISFIDFAGERNAVVTRTADAGAIKSWQDLCGSTVGSLIGSSPLAAAVAAGSKQCTDAGKTAIRNQSYQSVAQELRDLEEGRIKAAIDGGVGFSYSAQHSGGKLAVAYYEGEKSIVGWGIRKDNPVVDKLGPAIEGFLTSDAAREVARKWSLPPDFLQRKPVIAKQEG